MRQPIQCGNAAKWQQCSIVRHWRVETCWSSSSGRDVISAMLLIHSISNEDCETRTNCRNTSVLSLCRYRVLREGNEDTCKDVNLAQPLIFNLERRGDERNSKDVNSSQKLISKCVRREDECSSKDASLQHCRYLIVKEEEMVAVVRMSTEGKKWFLF